MGVLRAFAMLLLSCLTLSSCGIFSLSPFPTALAQTLAVRDFSAEIDDPSLDEFQPFVLESGATRLILLVGGQLPDGQPYPAGKPWLFVLKEDLSLAQAPFTLDDLGAVNGTRAMIDSDGHLVVGTALFDVVGDTIVPAGNTADMGSFYNPGFPIAPGGDNVSNISSSGLTLNWEKYDFAWATLGSGSCQIRSTGRNLWLRDVFAGPDPATTTVILAFEEESDPATGDPTTYFVRVPRAQFAGSPAPNFLEDKANYPSTTKTDLESSHMGYTSDGIVAYEYTSQSWIMFPFDAPNVVQQLYVGNIEDDRANQLISWSYSGGYSCMYDKRTQTLSKAATWWK